MQTIDKWEALRLECFQWSYMNFGDQPVERPLMGLLEEHFEEEDSINESEAQDAQADQMIYFMDFMSRLKLTFTDLTPADISVWHPNPRGMMVHCMLKRLQGIRGYEKDDFFRTQMLGHMSLYFYQMQEDGCLYDVTRRTWDETVSKRNWVKE